MFSDNWVLHVDILPCMHLVLCRMDIATDVLKAIINTVNNIVTVHLHDVALTKYGLL